MLSSIYNYFYDRRRGFALAGGFVGGAYLLGQYAAEKLRDVQRRLTEDKSGRENLQRRFGQNQSDCQFTVLALLPTFGDQLFESMDVEALTSALQTKARRAKLAEVAATVTTVEEGRVGSETPQTEPETATRATSESQGGVQASGDLGEAKPGPNGTSDDALTEDGKRTAEPTTSAAEATNNGPSSLEKTEAKEEVGGAGERSAEKEGVQPYVLAEEGDTTPATTDAPSENPEEEVSADSVNVPDGVAGAQENGVSPEHVFDAAEDAAVPVAGSAFGEPQSDAKPNGHATQAIVGETGAEWAKEFVARADGATGTDGAEKGAGGEPARSTLVSVPPAAAAVADVAQAFETSGDEETKRVVALGKQKETSADGFVAAEKVVGVVDEREKDADRRTKAEIWNEIKVLSFSRSLTALYTLVLLTLLTHVQVNLLGRFNYVSSVFSLASATSSSSSSGAARIRLQNRDPLSPSGEGEFPGDLLTGARAEALFDDGEEDDEEEEEEEGSADVGASSGGGAQRRKRLAKETEQRYLTFAWWVLHVGWKKVAERVRSAVEDVFGGLSLKRELSFVEMEELIGQVRNKIEWDRDAQGRPVPFNFLPFLLPLTPADENVVLAEASGSSASASFAPLEAPEPELRSLLEETCDIAESPDFSAVLSLSLDAAFDVFERALCPAFGVDWDEVVLLRSAAASFPRGHGHGKEARLAPMPISGPRLAEVDEKGRPIVGSKARLATLFPLVSRQSTLAVHGVPNEYLEALGEVKELTALSAIIYSAWEK